MKKSLTIFNYLHMTTFFKHKEDETFLD